VVGGRDCILLTAYCLLPTAHYHYGRNGKRMEYAFSRRFLIYAFYLMAYFDFHDLFGC